MPVTPAEKEHARRIEQKAIKSQQAHDAIDFTYLDMFEA